MPTIKPPKTEEAPAAVAEPVAAEPPKEAEQPKKEFVLFQLSPDTQVQAELLKLHSGEAGQADLRVHIHLDDNLAGDPFKDFLRVRKTDAQPHRMLPGTWQPNPPAEEGV